MSPLPAIALVTLLIPGAPPIRAVPRHGPLLSAALAIQPVQRRTPHPIRPSPVHASRRVRAALIGGFDRGRWRRNDRVCHDEGLSLR